MLYFHIIIKMLIKYLPVNNSTEECLATIYYHHKY